MKCSFKNMCNNIKNNYKYAKYQKHQKELDKYANLTCVTQQDAKEQLYNVQEILANYAKANNVTLTMISKKAEEPTISILAQNSKTCSLGEINSNLKKTEVLQREKHPMLEDKDGCNYIATGIQTVEDNFLRRVYRKVDMLVADLNKKTAEEYRK